MYLVHLVAEIIYHELIYLPVIVMEMIIGLIQTVWLCEISYLFSLQYLLQTFSPSVN